MQVFSILFKHDDIINVYIYIHCFQMFWIIVVLSPGFLGSWDLAFGKRCQVTLWMPWIHSGLWELRCPSHATCSRTGGSSHVFAEALQAHELSARPKEVQEWCCLLVGLTGWTGRRVKIDWQLWEDSKPQLSAQETLRDFVTFLVTLDAGVKIKESRHVGLKVSNPVFLGTSLGAMLGRSFSSRRPQQLRLPFSKARRCRDTSNCLGPGGGG